MAGDAGGDGPIALAWALPAIGALLWGRRCRSGRVRDGALDDVGRLGGRAATPDGTAGQRTGPRNRAGRRRLDCRSAGVAGGRGRSAGRSSCVRGASLASLPGRDRSMPSREERREGVGGTSADCPGLASIARQRPSPIAAATSSAPPGSRTGNRQPVEPDQRTGTALGPDGRGGLAAAAKPIGPASFSGIGRTIRWSAVRRSVCRRANCESATIAASSAR